MSDKINVISPDEVYSFERRCQRYLLEFEEIERELSNAVNKVAATWRDRDFIDVQKLVGSIEMDISLAKKIVREDLLPYLANKIRTISEKRG